MGSSSTRSRSRSAWNPLHLAPFVFCQQQQRSPYLSQQFHRSREGETEYTNLSLGLEGNLHIPRVELFGEKMDDWPLVKPLVRSEIAGSFFIKVYMEGVLIGRKLDLLAHNDYDNLITSLAWMFNTNIRRPGESATPNLPNNHHVLTYEDKDGDWMMVGDVPWEMFKCMVKRMLIVSPDKC